MTKSLEGDIGWPKTKTNNPNAKNIGEIPCN